MDYFKSQRLTLRRMTENDFDFFVNLTQDTTITKYFGNFRNLENPENDFSEIILGQQNHETLFLVICLNDGTPIGIFDAFYMANDTWLVEYALLSKYRRQGYITEILTQICQNDFEFLSAFKTSKNSISSLLFEIQPENTNSQKVLKRVARKVNLSLDVDDVWYELTF